MAALLLVPLLAAVQVATSPSAHAVDVAGFEIDGNTPVDGTGLDWATTGDHATDPVGNVDTTTFKGSKEFEHPNTWVSGVGLAPNQDDVSDVYNFSQTLNDDVWSYFGFRRFTTSGTTNYDVEYNQKPNKAGDLSEPVRTVNDLMVRFEQDGNDAFQLTLAYLWELTASPEWGAGCIEVPGYTPAAGWCQVDQGSSGFVGMTGEDGHFAEGTLNISSFFTGEADCRGAFGTMNLRSFTGNSDESALKDYVDPIPVNIPPNCGQLKISKVDQFGNPVGGATFKITTNPIPGVTGGAAAELVITDGSAEDPDGAADGFVSINPARPDTYTVAETVTPQGYILDSTVYTNVVVGDSGTSIAEVSFTNPLKFQPVSILNEPTATKDVDYNWKIHKSVDRNHADVPAGTQADFSYTVTLEALEQTSSGRELGGTVTLTNPNAHEMVVTLGTKITGGADCAFPAVTDASGAPGLQVDLTTGAHEFDYTCTPAPAGSGSTTATASWDSATYPQGNPGATYQASDESPYSYAIDQKTDESTTVTDIFNGGAAEELGTFTWGDVWGAANHTVTVATYPRSLAGVPGTCTDYPNTASESADQTNDSETVTVCVGTDLTLTKDASLGYHRTYEWDIAKSGPGTVWVGKDGQGNFERNVSFDIDVMATGFTDSGYELAGTITVSNDNDWAMIGTLTDTVMLDGNPIVCDITAADVQPAVDGHQVNVPANTDAEFAYTCDGVQKGDYIGKNTATISWDKAEYFTPNGSATGEADVVVSADEPTNKTITLSDLLDGSDVTADLPQTSFDWSDVRAMTDNTQTLAYQVSLGTAADECTPHTNKVTIDQTGQNDSHTVIVCSPGIDKSVTASFGKKQLWDLTKQADKTKVEVSEGGTATFNYTVVATPGDVVDDGSASWTGSVAVHNPSETEALTVDLSDTPAVEGWTCEFTDAATSVEVAAGQTENVAYECSGQGHPDGTNTSTATFGGHTVSDTAQVKFAARADVADSIVTVTDDKTNPGSPVELGQADASDPSTWTFEYSLDKGGVAGQCTTYTNNAVVDLTASPDEHASADVKVCVEEPLSVDVSASGNYGVTYPWMIEKDVDKTTVEVDAETGEGTFNYSVTVTAGAAQRAGWTMGGTIEVTNPNGYADGAITLTGAEVTTTVGGGAVCTATLPEVAVVPVDGSLAVPFTCTFTGEPSTSGDVSASVTWDPAGPAVEATASDSGTATLSVGEEIDKTVDVIDDKTNPANPVVLEEGLTWAEGLVKTYNYPLTLPGVAGECVDHTNTAIVDLSPGDEQAPAAVDENGNPTDSETVTVCVEAPLGATASAKGDLARAYDWSIAKSVDATQRTVDGSGNATFRYTVVAKAGAATDSGWQMSGSVTLANPNTYADGDITADVSVASSLGGGSACVVTGGEDAVVPAEADGSGSVTLPITCTFTSQPASSGDLTVTATWDPAGEASSADATAVAPVNLAVGSETNKVVDIVDDKTRPGERVVLEKGVVWSAGLVKTYTYDLTLAGGAPDTCRSYTNMATVDVAVGADPSAIATVQVCAPPTPPVVVLPPPEVLPEEAFGKAVGNLRATCQGTVRARLKNRSGVKVTYKVKVGKKVHRVSVKSLDKKKFTTQGAARAKVRLKLGRKTLDRLRIPERCAPPEVLPETGLRIPAAKMTALRIVWR